MRACTLRKLHRAVDRHAAEPVTVQPMQAGGYLAPQASGDPAETVAYIATVSERVRSQSSLPASGHNVDLSGASHTAKFRTASLPFEVQNGFVVTRAADGSVYRVAGVNAFGIGRTILALARLPGVEEL